MISVQIETSDQADVTSLIRLSDEVAAQLYPGAYRRPLNARSLDRPDILTFVARTDEGRAVGFCALFFIDDGTGEIKRMIVDPAAQRRGVGQALVRAVIETARTRGIGRLQLEVGVRNVDARSLYERMGFRSCGPFGQYTETSINSFMERDV